MKSMLAPNFQISNNLKQSWHLLKGSKGPMWLAISAWVAITLVILGMGWLLGIINPIGEIILTLIIITLTTPFFAGINMIAIKRARGEVVNYLSGFQYFNKWISLAVAFIVIFVISGVLTTLLNLLMDWAILPFIPKTMVHKLLPILLLMVLSSLFFTLIYTFFLFTIPFIIDRQFSVLQALKHSIIVVKPHWWQLFSLMAIFYGLNLINILIAQIPYGGLICYIIISICLLPFAFLNIGVAYHQLND